MTLITDAKLPLRQFYCHGIATITWHLITNDEMYEDETEYEKGEVKKRKIVETETFLADERMTIY